MPFSIGEISFNPNTGRYRRSDGKFVSRQTVLNLAEQEQQQLSVRLKGITRLLAGEKITLGEWQLRMAEALKDSHLRLGALGAGGADKLGPQQYGAIGYQLQRQYQYLDGFANALYNGRLTIKQAIARAGLYGESAGITFNRIEQISREADGFTEAKRNLDPQARHCPSCLRYATNKWVPIDQVVSPGTACECQNKCRCQIQYRRGLSRPGILAVA